ncbi:MAG: DciA family protein [Endomicrobiia bacterium]|nr:DciA family protein [Endomicrobiia bacterium]
MSLLPPRRPLRKRSSSFAARGSYDNKPGPRISSVRRAGGAFADIAAEPAGGIALKSALAAFGLTDDIGKTFDAWDELAPSVRSGARLTTAGRGTIFLEAPSSSSMHRIFYNKSAIIAAINRRIGSPYVKDIKIEIAKKTTRKP